MEAPREFTRAVNAAKLQQVFAKPFTAALDGHRDVVNCMSKHPQKLSVIVSGAGDGEVSKLCAQLFYFVNRQCFW